MPVITLPDGSQKAFDCPVSVAEVASSIGAGLALSVCQGGEVDLRDGCAGHRHALETGEHAVDRAAEGALNGGDGNVAAKRRDAVLQASQFVGDIGRQQVAPRR